MYNIGDDNELDRISREAAGRYSPPAGGSDWESLSAELDKVLPVTEEKKRRGFFFWWLLPVLLAGGGIAYWQMTSPVKTDVQKESVAGGIDKQDQSTEDKKTTGTTIKTDVQKEPVTITNDKKDPVTNNTNIERPVVTANTSSATNNQRSNKQTNTAKQTNAAAIHSGTSESSKNQVTANSETATTEQLINKEKTTEAEQKNNTSQSIQQIQQPVKENKVEAVQEPVQSKADEQKETTTTPLLFTARGKGWSYGFIVGIDKSTVKFKYGNNPGINLGMIGGYHFNDRLSIHTGAIYTQKNYKVAGEDFTAPKGSWASYYKIDNVEGYCRMWEVPVLVRYNLNRPAKKNVFLSAGLSSYFMTKEDYTYHYYTNSGQLVTRHTEYNSTDTHIMSIADFSVGFENRLTKNWSLQVEPYAKIPLSGVGLGDIQLSSFGLNFSVQYRQPSKK
jgi:hypothetical protein